MRYATSRMKPVTVDPGEISMAIAQAHALCPKQWQAEIIEIILIPKIYRRWRQLNPGSSITRAVHHEWGNGYLVVVAGSPWNSLHDEYASISASTAYDGISRQTVHGFADVLRGVWYDWSMHAGRNIPHIVSWGAKYIDHARILPGPGFGAVANPAPGSIDVDLPPWVGAAEAYRMAFEALADMAMAGHVRVRGRGRSARAHVSPEMGRLVDALGRGHEKEIRDLLQRTRVFHANPMSWFNLLWLGINLYQILKPAPPKENKEK